MKLNKIFKTIVPFVFFLFVSAAVFGQGIADPDSDEDDANEELNPAPIGDYILPMLVLGVATAFVLLRKRSVQEN